MSLTAPAPTAVTVNFEQEVVKLVVMTDHYLGDSRELNRVSKELMSTAPSFIAAKGCGGSVSKVIVKVRRANVLWTYDLERAVRSELATHRSNFGQVQLQVERY
jgi:hypothetical protein